MHARGAERLHPRPQGELRDGVLVRYRQLLKAGQQGRIDDDVEQSGFEEHLLRLRAVVGQIVVGDVDLLGHVTRVGDH
jgi:hypothetical protein